MERLIHADSSRIEVGMITDFISFDAQIHNNCEIADNTFSLEMSISAWKRNRLCAAIISILTEASSAALLEA